MEWIVGGSSSHIGSPECSPVEQEGVLGFKSVSDAGFLVLCTSVNCPFRNQILLCSKTGFYRCLYVAGGLGNRGPKGDGPRQCRVGGHVSLLGTRLMTMAESSGRSSLIAFRKFAELDVRRVIQMRGLQVTVGRHGLSARPCDMLT